MEKKDSSSRRTLPCLRLGTQLLELLWIHPPSVLPSSVPGRLIDKVPLLALGGGLHTVTNVKPANEKEIRPKFRDRRREKDSECFVNLYHGMQIGRRRRLNNHRNFSSIRVCTSLCCVIGFADCPFFRKRRSYLMLILIKTMNSLYQISFRHDRARYSFKTRRRDSFQESHEYGEDSSCFCFSNYFLPCPT